MKRAILFLLLLLIMTAGSYAQNIQTIGEPPDTLLQSFVKVDSLLIIRSIADTNKTAVPGGIYIFSGGLWLGSADSHYVEIASGEGVPGSGDIEGVVAGTGLSGGGTTGTVTLNLLLSARKGLEIDTDSLGIKVNGTTLITSSSGISANIGTASGTVAAGDHTHSGYISSTLASAKLLVGNGSNVATAVSMSGDATIDNAGAVAVVNDSHTHGTSSIEGLDISADTNLSASSGIVLTGDALSHSTADGYVHIPSAGAAAQILQYSSAGTAKWTTVSGDVTIADGGAVTLAANAADSTNLADGSVTSQTLQDGQVKTVDLAANSVDSTKIKDGAVTSESLQDGQVEYIDLAQAIKDSLISKANVSAAVVYKFTARDSLKLGSAGDVWFRSAYYDTSDSSVAFTYYNTALARLDTVYAFQQAGAGGSSSGDITGVTAGNGLSGGGAAGSVTLDILLSAIGGLQIGTDSLGLKLDGTTLAKSSLGLKVNVGTASGTVAAGDHAHSGYVSSTLSSAYILVGNGSNVATAVALSGDASLSNAGELTVSNDSHTHGTSTIEGLDISSDTNLTSSGAIVLTGDTLSHSTADGYVHIPSGGSSAQILQYSSAGTAKWITPSGDAAVADGGAVTVADSSHYHSVNDLVAGSSARFLARITNETGSGALVAGTSPTITGANLGVVAASTVSGQIQHLRFTLVAPNALVTAVGSPYNIPIWVSVDSAITVTRVKVTCDADPTTELTGDVKYADAFIGLANAAVINDFDTATGVRDDSSIGTASVAAGKCLYILFDAVPEAALKTIAFDIMYYYQ